MRLFLFLVFGFIFFYLFIYLFLEFQISSAFFFFWHFSKGELGDFFFFFFEPNKTLVGVSLFLFLFSRRGPLPRFQNSYSFWRWFSCLPCNVPIAFPPPPHHRSLLHNHRPCHHSLRNSFSDRSIVLGYRRRHHTHPYFHRLSLRENPGRSCLGGRMLNIKMSCGWREIGNKWDCESIGHWLNSSHLPFESSSSGSLASSLDWSYSRLTSSKSSLNDSIVTLFMPMLIFSHPFVFFFSLTPLWFFFFLTRSGYLHFLPQRRHPNSKHHKHSPGPPFSK